MMCRLIEDSVQSDPEMLAGQTLDDDGRQLGAWVYGNYNE